MRNPKLMPMNAPFVWTVFLWMALIGSAAIAADDTGSRSAVKVLVMPFQINAQSDLANLRTQIPDVLAQRLQKEGAQTVTVEEAAVEEALKVTSGDIEEIRTKARIEGAQQVVWGSFTLIGNTFSLDMRLMSSQAGASSERFYAQGQNLESLVPVVNDLADQIGFKLFGRQLVTDIRVQGNQRIEPDAILRVIKTQKGGVYRADALSKDLRAIYAMGYFDDVRIEVQSGDDGKIVIFHIKEKPTIRYINLKGNSYIEEEKIRENLTIATGSILNIFKVRSNIDQIETLYKEKNYHKAHIDYKIKPLDNNQADLEFVIEEGPKIYVTAITFEGNKAFSEKELKKKIKVSEKGFFYWLTSSGDLDRAALDQDVAALNAFYSNEGYINARVGEPRIDIKDEGIEITLKIDEGQRFKVGKVDVTGELIKPKDELLKPLSISKETYYNREKIRNDVLTLTDFYSDEGYAHADISPRIEQNPKEQVVDITFAIQKREQVYFEKIIISGNTNTRDKVIRRELHVHEQGLFSGKDLKRSVRNLYRLDYFEDIKVDTLKGSSEDKMVLKLDVTEKPTGTFSFGAGYSSEEEVFFTGSIAQRNLFGRGQTLNFTGTIGAKTTSFVLSFVEPYLLDTRLSGTASLYNQDKEYEDNYYDRQSQGGGLGVGYPVFDYTTARLGYRLDRSDVKLYSGGELLAPPDIVELEGINWTSSVDTSLTYDSRDRSFNATEGSRHSFSFEYAGLGGDIGFNKAIGQTMWYIPIVKKWLTGCANAKIGWVEENDDAKILPDYEKFYLGGITSLRGFGYHGVYVPDTNYRIDEEGEIIEYEIETGGRRMLQFNAELIFPIVASAGVNGVVFYDTGNVYENKYDINDLRQSAGGGIRWLSPIAPIRIEYGWILDRREGEQSGDFEFTLGGSF
jgi:outer membrane protein insertion porin family